MCLLSAQCVRSHRIALFIALHSFPSSYVEVQHRSPLTLYYCDACPCHQHCWSRLAWPLGKVWDGLPPPQLSYRRHLPAPVKLPQFLSVQCRPARFLIERCSEGQERRRAQCASVFGLAQKCFSWLNPLVLRSSYNKLKGPNCPQGRRLATIDMWWDKSPALLARHPHPPQIEETNTSAVSVLQCGYCDHRLNTIKYSTVYRH